MLLHDVIVEGWVYELHLLRLATMLPSVMFGQCLRVQGKAAYLETLKKLSSTWSEGWIILLHGLPSLRAISGHWQQSWRPKAWAVVRQVK